MNRDERIPISEKVVVHFHIESLDLKRVLFINIDQRVTRSWLES